MNHTIRSLATIIAPLSYLFSAYALGDNSTGVRLGTFTLTPTLESNNEWKSNIYSSQNGAIEDFITHTKPSVILQSDWSQHSLALDINSDIQNYASYDGEDRNIYSINLDGKFDVLRNSFARAKFTYSDQYENRGAPDSQFGLGRFIALAPTNYQLIGGAIGYEHKLNRLRITVDNDTQHYGYVDGITNNGTILYNNKNRSRLQNTSTIKLGYELYSGYETFVRGSYNTVDYDSKFNGVGGATGSGVQRSSTGYTVSAGVAVDLTGKLTGEAHVGYREQNYDDKSLKAVSGISGGVSTRWKATGLTTVVLGIDRVVNETTQQNASGFFSTPIRLSVDHQLLRNLTLSANIGYTMNDYTGGGNRQEDVYAAGISAKYLINRYFYVGAGYNFNSRSTNVVNTNYDLDVAYFTLGTTY